MREFPAQILGDDLAGNGIDHRMLGGRYPPAQPLETPQQRPLLGCGQRLTIERGHPLERGIQPIKSRRQRLLINNTARHNSKLTKPTDKKPHPETTETKVAEVISERNGQ
jgi:hypothetical protein